MRCMPDGWAQLTSSIPDEWAQIMGSMGPGKSIHA